MFGYSLAFWGTALSLTALLWKTIYDVWINPAQFRSELSKTDDHFKAAENKRRRTDNATVFAFLALAAASAFQLREGIMSSHNDRIVDAQDIASTGAKGLSDGLVELTTQLHLRIAKIEDYFDPTGPGGDQFSDEMSQIREAVEKLADTITLLEDKQQKDIRKLTTITADLDQKFKELERRDQAKGGMTKRATAGE